MLHCDVHEQALGGLGLFTTNSASLPVNEVTEAFLDLPEVYDIRNFKQEQRAKSKEQQAKGAKGAKRANRAKRENIA